MVLYISLKRRESLIDILSIFQIDYQKKELSVAKPNPWLKKLLSHGFDLATDFIK